MVTYQTPHGDAGPSQIFVNLAPPLLLPFGFGPPVLVTATNVGGQFKPFPGNWVRGIDAEANLAWDRSGSFHPGDDGRVYLVYVDSEAVGSTDTDIFVRYSDDSGSTWSERQRVNDDGPGAGQFMPQIAVNQYDGSVAVAWYDTRYDLSGRTSYLFASVRIADGPWRTNRRIGVGFSDAQGSGNRNGFGDYNTMDVVSGADGYFYPIWADNSRNGLTPRNLNLPTCDMATAKVRFLDFALPGPGGLIEPPPDEIDGPMRRVPIDVFPPVTAPIRVDREATAPLLPEAWRPARLSATVDEDALRLLEALRHDGRQSDAARSAEVVLLDGESAGSLPAVKPDALGH